MFTWFHSLVQEEGLVCFYINTLTLEIGQVHSLYKCTPLGLIIRPQGNCVYLLNSQKGVYMFPSSKKRPYLHRFSKILRCNPRRFVFVGLNAKRNWGKYKFYSLVLSFYCFFVDLTYMKTHYFMRKNVIIIMPTSPGLINLSQSLLMTIMLTNLTYFLYVFLLF